MCSAMASDAVAAGDGAFRMAVTGPNVLTRKSSTSDPSGSTACARTPGRGRTNVTGLQPGQVGPRLGQEGAPGERAVQLPRARPPVLAG